MTIVFFGTSEFAIPALKKLHESEDYNIVALVTQPDKPAGRKQQPLPSPVKVWAEKNGVKVLQPESLKATTYDLQADLFIVASYGKIIPQAILDIPKLGALNIHPSLLPKYRGPSPIQTAILNGDKETGVTIIKLDEEMDHGDIVASTKFEIRNSKPRFRKLHEELAKVAAELLIETLPKYISGEVKPRPQDHSKATFTRIVSKNDGRINWGNPAEEIDRQISAYEVWPVAWTMMGGKRLKIYSALPLPMPGKGGPPSGGPGEVAANDKLIVQTGRGSLELLELQLEAGKKMRGSEFLRGHKNLNDKTLD